MTTSLWNSLFTRPAIFTAAVAMGTTLPAVANPIVTQPTQPSEEFTFVAESPDQVDEFGQPVSSLDSKDSLAQVTSVSQLSDVQPTDWAFQSLQSLVERYGCIAGYPDSTYRGNRALTRYEFAAGLNACLDRVNELIAAATSDIVTKEDLATLQKLQEEFSAELASLRGRVDSLEAVGAEIEANQFSTTTKLVGEVIVGLAGIIDGEDVTGDDLDDSTILGDRARLELNTSFTGNDLLFTRLSTGNFPGLSSETGTAEGEFAFTQDEGNDLGLETLLYSFPVTEQTEVVVGATGTALDDFASTVNFLDGDGGAGALSAFGTRNPIYYLGDGAGLGIRQQVGDIFEVSVGYLAGEANDPLEGNGLFNGAYSAIGQVVFKPSDRFNIGLTYIHGYNTEDTGVGSSNSTFARFDDVFFEENLGLIGADVPTSSDSYGVELSWRVSDRFIIGGWAGYTNTRLLSTVNGLFDRGGLDIWNYAVTLALPDLGKEGNILGFVFGMEPKVTDSGVSSTNPVLNAELGEDDDTSFHIEGFYQYQVTENIAITPGVIWITAPGFNNDNQDLVVGAIRTTFAF